MQATLEDFIKALRASGVRVSPAEAIDAHRALIEIGYDDRTLLKDALCIALADFMELHREEIDRHTTIIILGDGRSNYANPRLDIMREISHRSRAVIWLNPEPETYWGQGDSRMNDYARLCHVAKVCNTLNQLERIIEDVLRTYLPH